MKWYTVCKSRNFCLYGISTKHGKVCPPHSGIQKANLNRTIHHYNVTLCFNKCNINIWVRRIANKFVVIFIIQSCSIMFPKYDQIACWVYYKNVWISFDKKNHLQKVTWQITEKNKITVGYTSKPCSLLVESMFFLASTTSIWCQCSSWCCTTARKPGLLLSSPSTFCRRRILLIQTASSVSKRVTLINHFINIVTVTNLSI